MSLIGKRSPAWVGLVLLLLGVAACSRVASLSEAAIVAPERLKLKNSTAQAARVVGELKGGDQVKIVARAPGEDGTTWAQVSSADATGWVEARYLVKEGIVTESRRIAEQLKDIPTQAIGRSKASLKLRLTPERTSDDNVATLLPSGTLLEIVARERKPRPPQLDTRPTPTPATNKKKNANAEPEVRYDEWLQVRLKDYAVLPAGWIYGGSVELDLPESIGYFVSSGRRMVGWQKLGTAHNDEGGTGDHYLVVERKIFDADERVDFDRVKVLAYDPVSREYTTPFRDDVLGQFPIVLKMDGQRGQFRLKTIDKENQARELEYEVQIVERGRVKVSKPAATNTSEN
jgi:hypothetical protein